MSDEIKNIDEENIEDILSQFNEENTTEDFEEESIEDLFNQFIEAIKNLPEEDKDKMYDNLKKMEENNTDND